MWIQTLVIGIVLLRVSTSQEVPKDMQMLEVKYEVGDTNVIEDIAIKVQGNMEFHRLLVKVNEGRKRRDADDDTGGEEEEYIFRDYDRGLEIVVPPNSTDCLVHRLTDDDHIIDRTMFDSNSTDEQENEAIHGVLDETEQHTNFKYRYNGTTEELDTSDLPDEILELCSDRELRIVEEDLEASESVSRRSTRMKRQARRYLCHIRRTQRRICLPYHYYMASYCCRYSTTGFLWRRRRYCSRWCTRRVQICYVSWYWYNHCSWYYYRG